MSSKIGPVEVLEGLKAIQDIPMCKHCKINKAATAPYDETTNLKLTPLTKKLIRELKKGTDIPEHCIICFCLNEFMKLPDSEKLKRLKENRNLMS
ncbi:MAG: hypothetical protein ABSF44_15435 [Candidatus Bathyarchaeia archaeon]|jgi:hypothetical protein